MIYRLALLLFAMIFLIGMIGCEGEQGPEGPEGPLGLTGGPGPPPTSYTYLGGSGEDCMHCHSANVADWQATHHANAYDDLVAAGSSDNLYCLQCHTVGFDTEVAYGDTTLGTMGPDVNGFDDYFFDTTDVAAERMARLQGVQCENCHGAMGGKFNQNHGDISFASRGSSCEDCHHTQMEEWLESGHGTVAGSDIDSLNAEYRVTGSSCGVCHSSEGFIAQEDAAWDIADMGDTRHWIGCPTCHDPHAVDNEHQLRNLGDVESPYQPGGDNAAEMSGYGPAQMCAQCHHSRRDTENVQDQIDNGYDHFGPHHSNQMDMYVGGGSYEIPGKTYARDHSHQTIAEACVKCHMVREAEIHGEVVDHPFHTFEPDVGNCAPCHTGITDFDIDGELTAIAAKMDELAVLFGYADAAEFDTTWDSQADGVEVWQREAAYAFAFVHDDGSHGVHNPTYAMSLLEKAIEYYGEAH